MFRGRRNGNDVTGTLDVLELLNENTDTVAKSVSLRLHPVPKPVADTLSFYSSFKAIPNADLVGIDLILWRDSTLDMRAVLEEYPSLPDMPRVYHRDVGATSGGADSVAVVGDTAHYPAFWFRYDSRNAEYGPPLDTVPGLDACPSNWAKSK